MCGLFLGVQGSHVTSWFIFLSLRAGWEGRYVSLYVIHRYIHVCTHKCMNECTCVLVHRHAHRHMCSYLHTHEHIHMRMNRCTHTCIHTYAHACQPRCAQTGPLLGLSVQSAVLLWLLAASLLPGRHPHLELPAILTSPFPGFSTKEPRPCRGSSLKLSEAIYLMAFPDYF